MKKLLLILLIAGSLYSQCNQFNWQQHSPNLEYCDLENVNIAWEDVSGFNFFGANLMSSNLTGTDFTGANLTNAILVDSDLTWATFVDANLTNANLSGSGLGAADFSNANLSGANLYGATLFDTNFSNACIEGAYGFPVSGYIGQPIDEGCANSTIPDWSLNPNDFEYVMAITARVFSGSEETGAQLDLLGAFYLDQCVGVAEVAEVPPFLGGGYAFLIQVYSHNISGDNINFKFYDNSESTMYEITENITFISDGIIGDLNNPLMLYAVESDANNIPVAESATHTLDEDSMITISLLASDIDGDVLNFSITDFPSNGHVTQMEGVVTYAPNVNFNGIDTFMFIANDGQTNSNEGTINLIVNAVNDAPYLYPLDDTQIFSGESFVYELYAVDVDGDSLIYTATASEGVASINIVGNILTIIAQEPNTTLNIIVTVSDGSATHSTSFVLTVLQQQTTCLDNNGDGWCDQFPTININGDTVLLLGEDLEEEYTDVGAICSDNEDGDISNQVEVSGQVVNMSMPDTYEIYYNCSDSDGNAAQTLTRTIVVMPDFISDENQDGFDDDAFMAGAQSGDANMDGSLDVVDVVIFINSILNGE